LKVLLIIVLVKMDIGMPVLLYVKFVQPNVLNVSMTNNVVVVLIVVVLVELMLHNVSVLKILMISMKSNVLLVILNVTDVMIIQKTVENVVV
jgi:hypothetical protein